LVIVLGRVGDYLGYLFDAYHPTPMAILGDLFIAIKWDCIAHLSGFVVVE